MSQKDVFIFELSQSSFNSSVILNSYKIPVFVEFMGFWSEPCIRMADSLSALATEFAGQFIFAKVDVDEQTELREEYKIENMPTLKVFKDGEVVNTIEGLVEESELREMLKFYGIYRKSDELRLQAREKHMAGETVEAIGLLTQAIQQDPSNTRVAMDMVQIMIDIGELEQATAIFNKLPDRDKESDVGRSLIGQLTFKGLANKTEGKEALLSRLEADSSDNDARFDLAICFVAEHDYRQAAEMLFAILENELEYKDGAAREMLGAVSNMLAPNEPDLAQEFRRRLGNLLAK